MAHKHQEAPNFKYKAETRLALVEKIFTCPELIATLHQFERPQPVHGVVETAAIRRKVRRRLGAEGSDR